MSDKPVAERLQVKKDRRLALADSPITIEAPSAPLGEAEVVVQFVRNRAEYDAKIPPLLKAIRADAVLWIAYPKLTSKLAGDLNRDIIHRESPGLGIDCVSQIAIDEDWSAMRMKRV
jgi:hypothetical protein